MSKSRVAERGASYALQTALEPAFGTSFDLLATAPQGVAKLRELILSLAFRGSLDTQQSGDEASAALLTRIRAEKNHAVAQGEIKAKLRQPEITEEAQPYGVPATWQWAPLEHIALRISDGSHNPPRDSGCGYPMLSSQNVLEGVVDFSNPSRYLSEADFEIENARTQIQPGDVLLTIVASLGRSAVVPSDAPKFAMQRSVATIRSPLNANYLSLFLRSPLARAYYDKHGKGTAQKGIYLGKLSEMPIPVAPLTEQARIVARVEELMQLCDALEAHGRLQDEQHARLVATLFDALAASASAEELAENWLRIATHFDLLLDRPEAVDALEQTLLQIAVRGLLVPQDPTEEPATQLLFRIRAEVDRLDSAGEIKRKKTNGFTENDDQPFELPPTWVWIAFDEIVRPDKPIAYGVLVPGPDSVDGVPFVRLADISLTNAPVKPGKNISPDVDAQFERTRLEGGEILIGVVGSIGKLGVAPMSWRGANIARAICRIVPTHLVDKQFVIQLLQSEFMQTRFKGDTRTLAQPTLNVGLIRNCPMPLPPLAEQHRIVARVEQLRRLCADLRERLQQARATQCRLADALASAAAQSPTC